MLRALTIAGILLAGSTPAAAWKANESTNYYAISGTTGKALYQSIGRKGPVISGNRRTIAITNWDLKWRRDYQAQGSSCKLVSALPFVTITYTLPKPAQKLTGSAAQKWARFSKGIQAHEKVHGDLVKELANRIIEATVGLTVENDNGCKKIREEVLRRVKTEFEIYKLDNSAFERSEMGAGGNVRDLVLGLVK